MNVGIRVVQSVAWRKIARWMSIGLQYALMMVLGLLTLLQGNFFAFAVGVVSLVWIIIALNNDDLTLKFGTTWHDRDARGWDTYFRDSRARFAVYGWVEVAMIVASFIYVPFPSVNYLVIDQDGMASYYNGMTITTYNPLTARTRYFSSDRSVEFSDARGSALKCSGRTVDGKGVEADVGAQLSLPFGGMETAYHLAGDTVALKRMATAELCARFAATVAQYSIATLPSTLTLEAKTADQTRGMNALGIRYNGLVYVGFMHAKVVQD